MNGFSQSSSASLLNLRCANIAPPLYAFRGVRCIKPLAIRRSRSGLGSGPIAHGLPDSRSSACDTAFGQQDRHWVLNRAFRITSERRISLLLLPAAMASMTSTLLALIEVLALRSRVFCALWGSRKPRRDNAPDGFNQNVPGAIFGAVGPCPVFMAR